MSEFDRPRGTRDFRPEEMARRRALQERLRDVLEGFGYGEVQTPTFEHLELFTEKSGQNVVDQLYAFQDKSDRDLTLRPELTAPVIRFYNNELIAEPKPLRFHYFGNCFRYERPQSGRYREFWQIGIELIGAGGPSADAEVIAVAQACIEAAKVPSYELRVGHIGLLQLLVSRLPCDEETRSATYPLIDKDDPDLRTHLEATGAEAALVDAIETVATFETALDLSARPETVAATVERHLSPVLEALDRLELKEAAEQQAAHALAYLTHTLSDLAAYDVAEVTLDLGVARGLDYYTGVVFEFEAPDLGAEKQICGGGSYTLAEVLGGQPTPTAGFGLGFDRVLLVSELEPKAAGPQVHLAPIGEAARLPAAELATELRRAGIRCTLDINERSPSKNLDFADKNGIPRVLLLGSNELEAGTVTVKEMSTGDQVELDRGKLIDHLQA